MLIARYEGEAERKRLEYVLDRFKNRVTAEKPSGAVWIIDGEPSVVRELLEEVLSRIPGERVRVYRLGDPGVVVEEKRGVLEVHTDLPPGEAWGAVGLALARLRGSLVSEVGGERVYTVRPRGGYARVRVRVLPGGGGSRVRLVVEGYGSGFQRLLQSLEEELGLLGVVVRVG